MSLHNVANVETAAGKTRRLIGMSQLGDFAADKTTSTNFCIFSHQQKDALELVTFVPTLSSIPPEAPTNHRRQHLLAEYMCAGFLVNNYYS